MSASIKYRPEVDGLRALAVTAVVAYHAGLPGITGGYVGVDVFFVISGFLITQLLTSELSATGRIDLFDFYARRTRRLIPALCLVLATTIVAALWLLPADEQQALARSALAAIAFASNIWFWHDQAGYFHTTAETQPLLHTWSLAVEEQFYLIWPLLILLVGRFQRRALTWTIAILALASLALSVQFTASRPSAAFYLSPTRAWELGVGALLALNPLKARDGVIGNVAAAAGLAAITFATFAYSPNTSFPGLAAIAPVLGSVLVIAAGQLAPEGSFVGWIGSAPMTYIGRRSYSWYLWHWPLLALVRSAELGRNLPRDLLLALAAFALSEATYRWVERPVRTAKSGPFAHRRTTLLAGAALLILSACAAGLLFWRGQVSQTTDPKYQAIAAATAKLTQLPDACQFVGLPAASLPPAESCLMGPATARKGLLLIGDSHAAHYWPALARIAQNQELHILSRVQNGCRPQTATPNPDGQVPTALEQDCPAFNRLVQAEIAKDKAAYNLVGVMVAGSWRDQPRFEPELESLVHQLRGQGLAVLLVADVPRHRLRPPACIARRPAIECGSPRQLIDQQRTPTLAVLDRVARRNPGVTVWDPINTLCNEHECPATGNGVILYRDQGHLSPAGAQLLTPALAPVIRNFVAEHSGPAAP